MSAIMCVIGLVAISWAWSGAIERTVPRAHEARARRRRSKVDPQTGAWS